MLEQHRRKSLALGVVEHFIVEPEPPHRYAVTPRRAGIARTSIM